MEDFKPSDISVAIDISYKANVPLFIWGPPGVGKTSLMNQYAAANGLNCITLCVSQIDQVDLRGLPEVCDHTTTWARPDFLPSDPDWKGILFLDEVTAALPSMQVACYQLIEERRVGPHRLPPGCVPMGAGNELGQRAVVQQMSTALASRVTHVRIVEDLEDFVRYALTHDFAPMIPAFLRFRPDLLMTFPHDPRKADKDKGNKDDKSFACPRTWEKVSNIVKVNSGNHRVESGLIRGEVGDGPGSEFSAFSQMYRELPDFRGIVRNPQGADIPSEMSVLYATCVGLSKLANDKTIDNIMAYGRRLPEEFTVLLGKDAVKAQPSLFNTEAITKFTTDYQIYLT